MLLKDNLYSHLYGIWGVIFVLASYIYKSKFIAHILLFTIIGLFCIYIYKKKIIFMRNINILSVMIITLIICFVNGVNNGYLKEAFEQGRAIGVMVIIPVVTFISYQNNLLNIRLINKYIYTSMVLAFVVRVLSFLLIITGVISSLDYVEYLKSVDEMMSDALLHNPDDVMEVMLAVANRTDIVPMFIFAFYLKEQKVNKLILFLAICYVVIGYSRVMIAWLVFLLIYFYFYKMRITMRNIGIATIIMICLFFVLSDSSVSDFFIERFTGDTQAASDSIRNEQYYYLMQGIGDYPFLGKGLGSYADKCIRSSMQWAYELEIVAYLFQLGILGFVFFLMNFFYYIISNIFFQYNSKCIDVLLMCLTMWIINGSIQGFLLIGSLAGQVIMTLYLLSRLDKNDEYIVNDNQPSF